MADYARQMSAGEIIHASYKIYFRHWLKIVAIYFSPTLPLVFLAAVWAAQPAIGLTLNLVVMLAGIFAGSALTIALSDLCLQQPISVSRAYRLILGSSRRGKIIGTWLLVGVQLVVGYVLLIVPGLVLTAFYMFSMSIVALEGVGGRAAMRRSRMLGRSKLWRNSSVVIGLIVFSTLLAILLALLMDSLILVLAPDFARNVLREMNSPNWNLGVIVVRFLNNAISMLVFPPVLVATVLVYYDMRARKEAFDNTSLAAELMH